MSVLLVEDTVLINAIRIQGVHYPEFFAIFPYGGHFLDGHRRGNALSLDIDWRRNLILEADGRARKVIPVTHDQGLLESPWHGEGRCVVELASGRGKEEVTKSDLLVRGGSELYVALEFSSEVAHRRLGGRESHMHDICFFSGDRVSHNGDRADVSPR